MLCSISCTTCTFSPNNSAFVKYIFNFFYEFNHGGFSLAYALCVKFYECNVYSIIYPKVIISLIPIKISVLFLYGVLKISKSNS